MRSANTCKGPGFNWFRSIVLVKKTWERLGQLKNCRLQGQRGQDTARGRFFWDTLYVLDKCLLVHITVLQYITIHVHIYVHTGYMVVM